MSEHNPEPIRPLDLTAYPNPYFFRAAGCAEDAAGFFPAFFALC